MYFEGYSMKELVEKFNIKNRSTLYEWVCKAREYGFKSLEDHRGLYKTKKENDEQSIEEKYEKLKLENEYLKKLLDLKRG